MSVDDGDVVHVALDCVRDEDRGGYRILVRGVFDDAGAEIPPPADGGTRNLVSWFLNVPSGGEPGAFFIGDAPSVSAGAGQVPADTIEPESLARHRVTDLDALVQRLKERARLARIAGVEFFTLPPHARRALDSIASELDEAVEALRASADALEELMPYLRHGLACARRAQGPTSSDTPCTCGLSRALAAVDAQEPET